MQNLQNLWHQHRHYFSLDVTFWIVIFRITKVIYIQHFVFSSCQGSTFKIRKNALFSLQKLFLLLKISSFNSMIWKVSSLSIKLGKFIVNYQRQEFTWKFYIKCDQETCSTPFCFLYWYVTAKLLKYVAISLQT